MLRSITIASLILALSAAAPTALACKATILDRVAEQPSAVWTRVPKTSELLPGEVAIRFAYVRGTDPSRDASSVDFGALTEEARATATDLVIISCFSDPVISIVEVVGGDDPGSYNLWIPFGYNLSRREGSDAVLVGRLLALQKATRSGAPIADDSPRFMIRLRAPPE
jgi:hypothetical protein